jgi:primosomal protein N' (replication factor Y)
MQYIEVLVASAAYHGQEALTYCSPEVLTVGAIVLVPLRRQHVLGIVSATVKKPSFTAKQIIRIFPVAPLPAQTLELIRWMQAFYPAPLGAIVQLFLPKNLSDKHLDNPQPSVFDVSTKSLPPLTKEQQDAVVAASNPGMYLLHGETGSGKTRAYIELARRALNKGLSSIILTPEIGLTSQLADDFRTVFGKRVIVIHSQLTDVARQKAWIQINNTNKPLIIVGARSALFSPLSKVGLLIIDESHEAAYKQDQAPHYHATRVASKLADLHNATIVLGSATPLITDYFLAEQKMRPIIRMTKLARSQDFAPAGITVVDLKDHSQFTRKSYLSDVLLTEIETALQRGEQSLIFLNRRGTARVIFCEKCGWQALCPHCDVPLVYHGDDHNLRCHTCSFKQPAITSCPECKNPSIIFKSIGTKALTETLSILFPHAKIQRFDTDNKRGERIEEHFKDIRSGKIDIVVGTQTLAKGLDLPHLGLVGVIVADTSLYIPDYNAEERTYQLLSQVLGRVGRGHRASKAIVQTYTPDSPILQAILTKNWSDFYQKQLQEREQFLFPPFCYVLKLTCRRASLAGVEAATGKFADKLRTTGLRINIEGPAPSFHEKVQNKYQWQLIIKARKRNELIKVIAQIPSGWSYDIDPVNLL